MHPSKTLHSLLRKAVEMCGQWIITKAWARPWSYETLSTTHISCSQECELPIVWHPGTQLMLGQHRQLPDISCLRDKCATHYKTRSWIIMRPNWEVSGQSLYSFSKPPSQLQVSPSMTPKKTSCVTDLHHSECYFCIICVNSWMKFPRHIFSTLANSMKMPKCKRALSFKGKKLWTRVILNMNVNQQPSSSWGTWFLSARPALRTLKMILGDTLDHGNC